MPEGWHSFEWESGASYEGQWRDGVPHGLGCFVARDGNSFEGHWCQGQPEGSGHLQNARERLIYSGDMCAGFCNGSGSLISFKHRVGYEGQWARGQPHGKGRQFSITGSGTVRLVTGAWGLGVCRAVFAVRTVNDAADRRGEETDGAVLALLPLALLPLALQPGDRSTEAHPLQTPASGWGAGDLLDVNRDQCELCGKMGELVCCDGCPKAFHIECVGLSSADTIQGRFYCHGCAVRLLSRDVVDLGHHFLPARTPMRSPIHQPPLVPPTTPNGTSLVGGITGPPWSTLFGTNRGLAHSLASWRAEDLREVLGGVAGDTVDASGLDRATLMRMLLSSNAQELCKPRSTRVGEDFQADVPTSMEGSEQRGDTLVWSEEVFNAAERSHNPESSPLGMLLANYHERSRQKRAQLVAMYGAAVAVPGKGSSPCEPDGRQFAGRGGTPPPSEAPATDAASLGTIESLLDYIHTRSYNVMEIAQDLEGALGANPGQGPAWQGGMMPGPGQEQVGGVDAVGKPCGRQQT